MQFYGICNLSKTLKSGICKLHKYGGLVCISDIYEIDDYTKIIYNNKAFINKYLKKEGYTHLHSFKVINSYYTDEFVVPNIMFSGCKLH